MLLINTWRIGGSEKNPSPDTHRYTILSICCDCCWDPLQMILPWYTLLRASSLSESTLLHLVQQSENKKTDSKINTFNMQNAGCDQGARERARHCDKYVALYPAAKQHGISIRRQAVSYPAKESGYGRYLGRAWEIFYGRGNVAREAFEHYVQRMAFMMCWIVEYVSSLHAQWPT